MGRVLGTIVAGWDGSEEAGRAVRRAAELARELGSRLVVARVLAMPLTPEAVERVDPVLLAERDLVPPAPDPSEAELAELRGLVGPGLDVELVTVEGEPADVLGEVADERGADLLVAWPALCEGLRDEAGCDLLLVR